MKVLISGASGKIGQVFREHYRNYYSLKLIHHQGSIKASSNEEVVQADITDFDSLLKAMEGIEAVVHLAADARDEAPWDSILNLNLIGTYNIFESAHRCGIKKIVYASSNHACGFAVKESELVGPDAPIRPTNLYGVSKVFGEALGRYYSDNFGLSVICLRIGVFLSKGWNIRNLFKMFLSGELTAAYPPQKLIAMWISDYDVSQLIHKSLESNVKFGIFYGTSNNSSRIFDITPAKEKLGYKPQDKAENYL
jgi:nucleoside-diphosphate-sugar epimerase